MNKNKQEGKSGKGMKPANEPKDAKLHKAEKAKPGIESEKGWVAGLPKAKEKRLKDA